MAKTDRTTKGTSLAKGPVGLVGLLLSAYRITAVIFGGHNSTHAARRHRALRGSDEHRTPRSTAAPQRSRRVPMWFLAGMLMLAFATAGCGSSSTAGAGSGSAPQHVHFAKTKFLLHAGLAFGAFHRYIYKPFRSGGFTPPLRHKLAIIKAGAAALFAYHEVKVALVDAQSSSLLSKLVSPLTALQTRLSSLGQHLHSGQLDSSAINGANGGVTNISSLGAKSGAAIHDLATPSLGG